MMRGRAILAKVLGSKNASKVQSMPKPTAVRYSPSYISYTKLLRSKAGFLERTEPLKH